MQDLEADGCFTKRGIIESDKATIRYFRNIEDSEAANKLEEKLNNRIQDFAISKCSDKIGAFNINAGLKKVTIFKDLDKKRIEEDSKYKVAQKVFFGAVVLFSSLLIITIFGKRK